MYCSPKINKLTELITNHLIIIINKRSPEVRKLVYNETNDKIQSTPVQSVIIIFNYTDTQHLFFMAISYLRRMLPFYNHLLVGKPMGNGIQK